MLEDGRYVGGMRVVGLTKHYLVVEIHLLVYDIFKGYLYIWNVLDIIVGWRMYGRDRDDFGGGCWKLR